MRNRVDTIEYMSGIDIVFRWAKKNHNLKDADLKLMFYLYPLKFFTTKQFKEGVHIYSWDKHRFARLNKEGWFKKVYEGNRRLGEHDKYALSKQAELLVRRIDRILKGEEPIPESTLRNPVMKGKTYSDKCLARSIKIYNKRKKET